MRRAAIDIGTHSVRLLLADVEQNALRHTRKYLQITRLGEGLAATGALQPQALARTVQAVGDFVQLAQQRGAQTPVFCYATSAAREAANGQLLLEQLRQIAGLQAEIIDGKLEAYVAYRGAACQGNVVLDIGGGSTELTCLQEGKLRTHSIPMGCVTLLERLIDTNPIAPAQRERLWLETQTRAEELCRQVLGKHMVEYVVGVGGTATQLAMLALKLPAYDAEQVQGFRMSKESLEQLLERLFSLSLEQRRTLPGMELKRADVIVPGCAIALGILQHTGAKALIASDRDGLDGYLAYKLGI